MIILLLAGIFLFVLGFFLTFGQSIWMEGSPRPSIYVVKAGANLGLPPWYLQWGDRTEGNFSVSGGSEEVRFYVRNPSGVIIFDTGPRKSQCDLGKNFTAEDSGMYSFIFENLDNVTDESIHVDFRSPHGLRPTSNYVAGFLTMLGSMVIVFFDICILWPFYFGKEPQDPVEFKFNGVIIPRISEYIGKILPRYWMKCLLFGMTLYIFGGISAVVSHTLIPDPTNDLTKGFGSDFYFLTLSIVTGFTSLSAIRALRGLGGKLVYIDRRLNGSSKTLPKEIDGSIKTVPDRLKALVDGAERSTWLRYSKRYYYGSLVFFSVIGGIVGLLFVKINPGSWIGGRYTISSDVFIVCCTLIGLTVGALIFISFRGIAILGRYCQEYVRVPLGTPASVSDKISDRKIKQSSDLLLDRLKQVGQFSFDLDLAAAIPSIAFAASYLQGTQITDLGSLIFLSTYTIVLILIFLLPLRPFHAKMVSAKEDALGKVNRQFGTAYSKFSAGDPRLISSLILIYDLHERIARTAVWPIDRSMNLKTIATISFPVALSVFSNFLSRLLGVA